MQILNGPHGFLPSSFSACCGTMPCGSSVPATVLIYRGNANLGNGFANIFSACFYAAADMVSVNIKLSLIQIATPNHLRGRVSTVNGIFISSSNEVDDVRAGSAAALFGPVAVVVIGGVVAIGMRLVVRCFLPNCAG